MKTFRSMSADRLREIVARFPHARIAVFGDYFLDKYLHIDPRMAETSLETGQAAQQVVDVRAAAGAAGTVAANLAALGVGQLTAIGFTGDDGEGFELRRALAQIGADAEHLHLTADRRTPTYLKIRDDAPGLAGERGRFDTKNRLPTPAELQAAMIRSLDEVLPHADAVIVADQAEESDCGAVTATIVDALAERAAQYPGVLFWADSRRRIGSFKRLIVKPNQFEAVDWTDPPLGAEVDLTRLAAAMLAMKRKTGAPVVITRGRAGMVVSDPEPTVVPGVVVDGPTDPTGAGDSATAGAVLALAAGASLPEAALLGNLVASITVQVLGETGTVRPAELAPRFEMWWRQQD